MAKPHIISAICTPLAEDEQLHYDGLLTHLDQQSEGGVDGILVAGTMGLLQLLKDSTYEQLVKATVEYWRGQGEILVGVGDTSYERTRQRIEFVNRLQADGVAALAPYFINLSQAELIDYYMALADVSRAPLFLYDLPQRTGTHLAFDTVTQLALHPNIVGIKCSGEIKQARRLHEALAEMKFRVLVAQPMLLDTLVSDGIDQHLDGLYCIAPRLAREIADAAAAQQKSRAADGAHELRSLLEVLMKYGVFATAALLLNRLGVAGNFLPRPLAGLTADGREAVLKEPIVKRLFESSRAVKLGYTA